MVDAVHPTAFGQIAIAERALDVLAADGMHGAGAPARADRIRDDALEAGCAATPRTSTGSSSRRCEAWLDRRDSVAGRRGDGGPGDGRKDGGQHEIVRCGGRACGRRRVPVRIRCAGRRCEARREGARLRSRLCRTSSARCRPAERKLDSRLVVTLRERQSRSATAAVPKLSTGVTVSKAGATEVDVRATALSGDLLDRLRGGRRRGRLRVQARRLGAGVDPRLGAGGGRAPGATCAGSSRPSAPITHAVRVRGRRGARRRHGPHAAARDRHRREGLRALRRRRLARRLAGRRRAAATSTCCRARRATATRARRCSRSSTTSRRTRELGFATAFTERRELRRQHPRAALRGGLRRHRRRHPLLQREPVPGRARSPSAVNDVTADGALFFSSAGNEGNTLDGTSGNYEGDFVDSGRGVGKFAGDGARLRPRCRRAGASSRSRRRRAPACR